MNWKHILIVVQFIVICALQHQYIMRRDQYIQLADVVISLSDDLHSCKDELDPDSDYEEIEYKVTHKVIQYHLALN